MRENADQNNSEYGHFLRSGNHYKVSLIILEAKEIRQIPYIATQ